MALSTPPSGILSGTAPPSAASPGAFARGVSALRSVRPRPEIALEEVPAPTKLAPYAFALGASVLRDGEEVTTGRLILLHDPAGHEAWDGDTRLVCYVTAEVEPELAHDALLPQVAWGWLVDALDSATEGYRAIGGTVTQTTSSPFGGLHGPTTTDLELRASWTPQGPPSDDLEAWCGLLASTAGLPPVGVASLPIRRA